MGLTATYTLTCNSARGCDAIETYSDRDVLLRAAQINGWQMDASHALALCPIHAPRAEKRSEPSRDAPQRRAR